jgi:hypothetical protein
MMKLAQALVHAAAIGTLLGGARTAAAVGTDSCAETDCASAASDCQCDGACTTFGDCCGDYTAVCGPAFGPAQDSASPADIFVTRSGEETSQSVIPGFFTHSGLKDYVEDNWFHSTGDIEAGILDCPLGLFGGVKYEARPSGGNVASAVFHVTNISDTQRSVAADMAFNHYLSHYPYQAGSGTAWSGDAEETGVGSPTYCEASSSSTRSNYDWAWIDTRVNDRAYCSALIYWSYSDATVDSCGTPISGAGFAKPLYDHAADFGPNCLWLGDHFDGIEGDLCDATGGLEGWDAAGHFLGWVQGSHEPDEDQVEAQCRAGVGELLAITPTELVENHVDEGFTEGYFAFSFAYAAAQTSSGALAR